MNTPFNAAEDRRARRKVREFKQAYPLAETQAGRRRLGRGTTAVEQARLIMLVMINVAQLWILAATVEAALAGHYGQLAPLVIASGVCWVIVISIMSWWRPASRRHTSTGYLRDRG